MSQDSILDWNYGSIFPHMYVVSSLGWGNYSSFHYIGEKLMRKLYKFFKVLQFQKRIVARIVAAATI